MRASYFAHKRFYIFLQKPLNSIGIYIYMTASLLSAENK